MNIKSCIGWMRNKFSFLIVMFIVRLVFFLVPIASPQKTIREISINRKSMLRIGDGEILWMAGIPLSTIETNGALLERALCRAITFRNKRTVVCINPKVILRHLHLAPAKVRTYYQQYVFQYWRAIIRSIPKTRRYGDACVSRFYIENPSLPHATLENYFSQIMNIWRGRSLLLVEGGGTKFGVGNDLLDKTKRVSRIICPDKGSFTFLEDIKNAILHYICDYDVCVMILGPTATVLVAELIEEHPNKQFVDLGSVDSDYMFFIHGKTSSCSISHKKVFGIRDDAPPAIVFDYDDQRYNDEIICDLSHLARSE